MTQNIIRRCQWGNFGITFWKEEPNPTFYHVLFPCGPQGPVDGYAGSPERKRYLDMCDAWVNSGTLPEGAVVVKYDCEPALQKSPG